MCLRRRTTLTSAGRTWILSLFPWSGGRAERAEQVGARMWAPSSRPGVQVRTKAGKRGSCSPTATLVSPLCDCPQDGLSSRLPPVVSSVPLATSAVVWTPHTRVPSAWVTTGNVAGEQGVRPVRGSSPAWARRSEAPSKCLRHRKRPGPSDEGPGDTRAWRGF